MGRLAIRGLLLVMVAAACGADTTSRIAFASDRDGNFEIYVMDADGANVTRLTDNPADDVSPKWAPMVVLASALSKPPSRRGG